VNSPLAVFFLLEDLLDEPAGGDADFAEPADDVGVRLDDNALGDEVPRIRPCRPVSVFGAEYWPVLSELAPVSPSSGHVLESPAKKAENAGHLGQDNLIGRS
jgi:hypothetical protein